MVSDRQTRGMAAVSVILAVIPFFCYFYTDRMDSEYPLFSSFDSEKIAIEVIEGKATIESLETTVKAFDAFKESQASEAAAGENGQDVNGGGNNNYQPPQNGEIKSQADLMAETNRTREMLGLEVN